MERRIQSRTYISVVDRGNPAVVRFQFTMNGTVDVSRSFTGKNQDEAFFGALDHALGCLNDLQGKKIKYNVSSKIVGMVQVLVHYADIFHEWNISGCSRDLVVLGLKSLNDNSPKAH